MISVGSRLERIIIRVLVGSICVISVDVNDCCYANAIDIYYGIFMGWDWDRVGFQVTVLGFGKFMVESGWKWIGSLDYGINWD